MDACARSLITVLPQSGALMEVPRCYRCGSEARVQPRPHKEGRCAESPVNCCCCARPSRRGAAPRRSGATLTGVAKFSTVMDDRPRTRMIVTGSTTGRAAVVLGDDASAAARGVQRCSHAQARAHGQAQDQGGRDVLVMRWNRCVCSRTCRPTDPPSRQPQGPGPPHTAQPPTNNQPRAGECKWQHDPTHACIRKQVHRPRL